MAPRVAPLTVSPLEPIVSTSPDRADSSLGTHINEITVSGPILDNSSSTSFTSLSTNPLSDSPSLPPPMRLVSRRNKTHVLHQDILIRHLPPHYTTNTHRSNCISMIPLPPRHIPRPLRLPLLKPILPCALHGRIVRFAATSHKKCFGQAVLECRLGENGVCEVFGRGCCVCAGVYVGHFLHLGGSGGDDLGVSVA